MLRERSISLCALLALGVVCSSAGAQRDTKDTINSIGRARPKTTQKAPPKAAVKRPAVVRRAAPARQSSVPARAVVRTTPKTTAPLAAGSNRFYVSAQGKADAKTISEALAIAKPGAEITVGPGIYRESLVLTFPVTIDAEENPNFDPPVMESVSGPCIVAKGAQATVRGLTFRYRGSAADAPAQLIDAVSGKLTLERCNFTGAPKSGIRVSGEKTEAFLRKCSVKSEGGPALTFAEKASGTVEECTLSGGRPAAVHILSGADPTLRNCRIVDSPEYGVFSVDALGSLVDCTVRNTTTGGVIAAGGANTSVRGGVISECADGAVGREGGRIVIEDVEVHHTRSTGISATMKGFAEIKDCKVHDVSIWFAIHADLESTLRMEGGEVHHTANSGIWAHNKSNLTIINVFVHDVGYEGITVKGGSDARIERCEISGAPACCIGVLQAKANVIGCKLTGSRRYGFGMTIDAIASLKDCTILGNAMGGIDCPDPKRLTVADSRVQR
jgi:hypothetical protein